MDTLPIEPIPHWHQDKGIRNATIFRCNHFYDYRFKENQVPKVDYDLCTTEVLENGDITYVPLYAGTVPIPVEVYSTWGEDDSPIVYYVASQLSGVTIIQ